MTGKEIDEHLKSGKRFVMFGEPVYYYSGENKTEPYKWYREGIAQAEIAIQSCTENEFDNSWYKIEKVVNDAMWLSCERERLQIEVQDLQQRVKELEEALRPFADEYVDYAVHLLQGHKANPQAIASHYKQAANIMNLLPKNGKELWEQ